MGTSTVMLALCVEECRALDRAIFGARQAGEDRSSIRQWTNTSIPLHFIRVVVQFY